MEAVDEEASGGWQGWVSKADCLTAPREITYDAALAQLLSNPIHELLTLRRSEALAQTQRQREACAHFGPFDGD